MTGAAGAYARSALMQLLAHPDLRPTVLCDLNVAAVCKQLRSLGVDPASIAVCAEAADVGQAVSRGKVAVVGDMALLEPSAFDVLVEATGVVRPSLAAAQAAISADRHVVMVSKETDATFGAQLAAAASDRSVVYTVAAGDQPANLVCLLEWARELGLDVIAAGKSSEYDLVYDRTSGEARLTDQRIHTRTLAELWNLGADPAGTVGARHDATAELRTASAADYCEITVMANITGFSTDKPELHYPVLRVPEIADVYVPRSAGGILRDEHVLDVFTVLRAPDEASFAGGVFVVVACRDERVWEMLAAKGHIVGRTRRYACIGLPFHLMGVELPRTVLDAAVHRRAVGRPAEARHAMIARTAVPFAAGTELHVGGHHHEIQGVTPEVVAAGSDAVPYHLLNGVRLTRDLDAGVLLTHEDIDGVPEPHLRLLAAARLP